jgi:guanylate kinase
VRRRKGRLYVVSAPSGAGKTSLCQALVARTEGLVFSVSYTTRAPRPGEVGDRDYTFVDEETFMRMAGEGEFVEWARVHGACYGTSRARLERTLEEGTSVMLDIDVQGAGQLRKSFEGGVYIFILPPSREALGERLSERGGDTPGEIQKRMKAAADEIREYLWYDYVIINDDFDAALSELQAVVLSGTLRADGIDPSWVGENFLSEEDV